MSNILAIEPKPNCIGKWVAIFIHSHRLIVYGNVIDHVTDEPMKPKRVRIQRGLPERHGDVVQPGEYEFRWLAQDEED